MSAPIPAPPPTRDVALHRLERLSGFLGQDPANSALRLELFEGLLQAREFERACQVADEAASGYDAAQRPAWQYRRAVARRLDGHPGDALEDLRALLAAGFDDPAIELEAARAELDLRDLEGAVKRLERLAASPPDAAWAERILVCLLPAWLAQGELDRAIAEGRKHLELDPASATIAGIVGIALLDAERIDEARALVEAFQAAGVHDGNLLTVAGFVALDNGDTAAAERSFDAALRNSPSLGRAFFGLGLVYAGKQAFDAARRSLVNAVNAMPSHLGSWHALAWVELLSEDHEAAAVAFSRAMEQDRTFGDNHGGLAIVCALRGETGSARQHIEVARRLDPHAVNAGIAEALLDGGVSGAGPRTLQLALSSFEATTLRRRPALRRIYARLLANHAPGARRS